MVRFGLVVELGLRFGLGVGFEVGFGVGEGTWGFDCSWVWAWALVRVWV